MTSEALEVATALRDRLPDGAERDAVIAQIAVLEKSNAAFQRAGDGVDRGSSGEGIAAVILALNVVGAFG